MSEHDTLECPHCGCLVSDHPIQFAPARDGLPPIHCSAPAASVSPPLQPGHEWDCECFGCLAVIQQYLNAKRGEAAASVSPRTAKTPAIIGRCKGCGCLNAVAVADGRYPAQEAEDAAEFLRNGYVVTRETLAAWNDHPDDHDCKCAVSGSPRTATGAP